MIASGQDMRRENARNTRLAAQFAHQFLARAVTAATRIAFVWNHHRAHELFHPLGDFARTVFTTSMLLMQGLLFWRHVTRGHRLRVDQSTGVDTTTLPVGVMIAMRRTSQ